MSRNYRFLRLTDELRQDMTNTCKVVDSTRSVRFYKFLFSYLLHGMRVYVCPLRNVTVKSWVTICALPRWVCIYYVLVAQQMSHIVAMQIAFD